MRRVRGFCTSWALFGRLLCGRGCIQLSRESLITKEGLHNLKEERDHLSTVKRREVAERIKEAREFGDIAENAEYDAAKNEQAMLEQRIAKLEERLAAPPALQKRENSQDAA